MTLEIKSREGPVQHAAPITYPNNWKIVKLTTKILTKHLELSPPAQKIAAIILMEKGDCTNLHQTKELPYNPGKVTHFNLSPSGGINLNSHASCNDLYYVFYLPKQEPAHAT